MNKQIQKLPNVNQELALKLLCNADVKNKKKQASSNLLKDERFKALFSNPDFQIDKNSVEYVLLNPVISQLDKNKAEKLRQQLIQEEETQDQSDEDKLRGNKFNYILYRGKFFVLYKKLCTEFFFLQRQ